MLGEFWIIISILVLLHVFVKFGQEIYPGVTDKRNTKNIRVNLVGIRCNLNIYCDGLYLSSLGCSVELYALTQNLNWYVLTVL